MSRNRLEFLRQHYDIKEFSSFGHFEDDDSFQSTVPEGKLVRNQTAWNSDCFTIPLYVCSFHIFLLQWYVVAQSGIDTII